MKKYINIEDLLNLEEMVADCAKVALRHARLGSNWMKDWKPDTDRAEIIDTIILKLMRCYSRSEYALKNNPNNHSKRRYSESKAEGDIEKHEKYEKYIEYNFRKCVETYLLKNCADQQHLDLILPIAFFSLILQNESNPESVSRRASKIYIEGVTGTPWKYRNPFKLTPFKVDAENDESEKFREAVLELERRIVKRNYYGHPIFSEKISNALNCTLHMEDQYRRIKYIAEHARAGMFLYDILKATHDESKPLNTILRMYMAMELHKTFDWTRVILSRNLENELLIHDEGLLLRYFLEEESTNPKHLLWVKVPLFYKGAEQTPDTRTHLNQKTQVREKYLQYYPFLHTNFDWEIQGFMEYYLNPDELEKYIGIDREIMDYISVMKSVLAALPQLELTTAVGDKISKLDQIFSTLFYD